MRFIKRGAEDIALLADIVGRGKRLERRQPVNYSGLVVLKPWGYEFELFDNANCSIWLMCLRPQTSTSLHCHQLKDAAFMPLTGGVTFRTLARKEALLEYLSVEKGTFHAQENNTKNDVFFLEYEWPSRKDDLVRAEDRYGRVGTGYEGVTEMVPLKEWMSHHMPMPPAIRAMVKEVA